MPVKTNPNRNERRLSLSKHKWFSFWWNFVLTAVRPVSSACNNVVGAHIAGIMYRCVLEVPSDVPLTEEHALRYFRDVVAGIEYRMSSILYTL